MRVYSQECLLPEVKEASGTLVPVLPRMHGRVEQIFVGTASEFRVPASVICPPRLQAARRHLDDHRVIADLDKQRRIGARHPNLAAKLRELDMQCRAPGGVKMGHNLVEQQDWSKSRHLGDQAPMGEDKADEECFL